MTDTIEAGLAPPSQGDDNATVQAAVAAVQCNRQSILDCAAALESFVKDIERRHKELHDELTELMTTTFTDSFDTMERLPEVAEKLEMLYARIDNLDITMDEMYEKIMILHQFVKTVEAPTDMKERAVGLLKSFGLKKDAEAHSSGIWTRIPPRILLDGSSPTEFEQRFVGVIRSLSAS